MTDNIKRTRGEWRDLAKDKARSDKRELAYIGQRGTVAEHIQYLSGVSYELAYPKDPKNTGHNIPAAVLQAAEVELVNIPLPDAVPSAIAVNTPLPAVNQKKKHKGMMPNGRTSKGVPDFKNWFGRVYPADITYPAWKYLSKTATDIANICRAKRDHAAHCNKKDSSGVPIFAFPFSEAVNTFKISRPTFDKSIKQLLEIGFIEYSSHGGIVNGQGIPAQYRLTDKWKAWNSTGDRVPKTNDRKKLDTLTLKQNPSKPVLHEVVNLPLPVEAELC